MNPEAPVTSVVPIDLIVFVGDVSGMSDSCRESMLAPW